MIEKIELWLDVQLGAFSLFLILSGVMIAGLVASWSLRALWRWLSGRNDRRVERAMRE